jgi:hypothetical protein
MAKVWDPHLLIAWGGTLGTPPLDVWTNTLKAIPYEPDGVTRSVLTVDEQDELLTLLEPIFSEFMNPATDTKLIGAAAKMTWIKANMIASTGKYMYPTTSVYDFDPAIPGDAASASDWRISLVPTLLTGKARGKAHSGRFYPPAVVPSMEGAGSPYVTTAQAQALANQAYALAVAGIGGVTLTSGKTLVTVITSPGETAVGVEPVSNMVLAVEVDRVPDTQRRRTNRVPRSVVGNA